MSHVATVEIEVRDLDVLAAAAKRCGLELRRNQKTYHWWGRSEGDYPIPAGFKVEELGTCEHALAVAGAPPVPPGIMPGDMTYAYEMGVCRRRDGKPGFTLLWDFMDDSQLGRCVGGQTANKLRQAYALEAAIKQARQQGFAVQQQLLADGSYKLIMSK